MYVNVHFDALSSFYGKRPVLSQARAFGLSPKVFVTLEKVKITLYFLHTKPDGSFSATNR